MKLARAFRAQARACAALESPFMERLLTLLAEEWPVEGELARTCADWPGDIGPHGASLPLRVASGLHALVLSGRDPTLAAAYPPNEVDPATLERAVLGALSRNEAFMLDWIARPPQTNEVRRSAVLIAAAHWLAGRHGLPFVLSELGASAGLNLMWDRYALQMGDNRLGPDRAALVLSPDWSGPVPQTTAPVVAERRGVDLNPMDPQAPDQVLRLFSYLWPDQPHRMALTRAAVAAQDAPVDRADAIDWLEARLHRPHPGRLHLVFHTIAWQYFPEDAQARGRGLIEAAGRRADDAAPLAWLRMESDGQPDGARVSARLWPGDERIELGRADFHGRWVRWNAEP